MPEATAKPIPHGAMVEICVDLVDEGDFKKRLDLAIRRAHRGLREYLEESKDKGGTATIVAKIKLRYDPDADDHVVIDHQIGVKTPERVKRSYVKERKGHLLCQPSGSSEDNPDQQRLFNPDGTIIPRPDAASNGAVAGKIG